MKPFFATCKSSLIIGLLLTLLLLAVILSFNPRFADSLTPLFYLFLAITIITAFTGTCTYLLFGRFFAKDEPGAKKASIYCFSSILFIVMVVAALVFIPDSTFLAISVILVAVVTFLIVPFVLIKSNILSRLKIPFIVLLCVIWIVAIFNIFESKKPARVSLIVFAIDGATWTVIDPLLEENRLPTIARLCEEGSYGILRSFNPTLSPIVWTTIASGKPPIRHGVKNFFDTANSVRTLRIWDILEQNGMNIGLFSYPVTWPPRETPNGFMFPSHFARGNETYPAYLSFLKEIGNLRKQRSILLSGHLLRYTVQGIIHGVRISTLYKSLGIFLNEARGITDPNERDFLDNMMKLYWYRDVYIHLQKKYNPEFAVFFMNQPDAISHLYWKYYEPEKFPGLDPEKTERYGDFIPKSYEQVDRVMGEILRELPDDVRVFVLSDHGFKSIQEPGSKTSYRIKTQSLIKNLELDREITGVNISNATVLQCERVEPDRFDAIIKMIEDVTLKENGEGVFEVSADSMQNIYVRVAHYNGTRESHHIDFPSGVIPYSEIVREKETYNYSGVHDLDGILIAKGEGIKKNNAYTKRSRIIDITPTVLAYLSLPIGRDMRGKPLIHLFEADSLYTISFVDTYDSPADTLYKATIDTNDLPEDLQYIPPELKKRLRSLGYVN